MYDFFSVFLPSSLTHTSFKKNSKVQGDFFTYADKQDEFWSGYYVSRSFYKYQCRTLFSRLRAAEILLNFARASPTRKSNADYIGWYNKLDEARKSLALFMHHDGITGTAKNKVAVDYGKRMKKSLDNTIDIMSSLLPHLFDASTHFVSESKFESYDRTEKRNVLELEKDVTLLIYNPTSSREDIRSSLVRLSSTQNRYCVFGVREDETWGPLKSQLSPVFDPNSRASNVAELFYHVFLPSFGAGAVKISSHCEDESSVADVAEIHVSRHALRDANRDWNVAFSDKIRGFSASSSGTTISIGLGEIRGTFDFNTGLLREIQSGECKREMVESFLVYKTKRSGAYLFMPAGSPNVCCQAHTVSLSRGSLVHQFAILNKDGT